LQAFEGLVLARKHGKEAGATFTVRKVASGVGVERIFPLFAPTIEKIEITKRASARRSKLYYIRNKAVKDVRKRLRAVAVDQNQEKEEMVSENTAE
jgi:large subunit ribosomal protein L19